jgi:integrase
MPYRRDGVQQWYVAVPTRTGRVKRSSGTADKATARAIERMVKALGDERAWDLLDALVAQTLPIGELYDAWRANDLKGLRARHNEVDLEPLVAEWAAIYGRQRPGRLAQTLYRVRQLIPEGKPLPRSAVTRAWLTEKLYAYKGRRKQPKPNTLRRVASAWSVFFEYLTDRGVLEFNPMGRVKLPAEQRPVVHFHEEEVAKRIVAAGATPELRGLFALAYGAAIELGVLTKLTRGDVWDDQQAVYAAGTKAHRRQRVCVVADWAWPYVLELMRDKLPTAKLFPEDWSERPDRLTLAHAETQRALKLSVYTLHHARHHWAATRLREGWPIADVQQQLGHSTPMLTLTTYGAFVSDVRRRRELERARTQRNVVGALLGAPPSGTA